MGTTGSGLPYPEPTDPLPQGSVAIKNLATALDAYPRGQLGLTRLGSTVDAGATFVTLCSTTVTLPSQRRIRVHANLQGQQITGPTTVSTATIYGAGAAGTRILIGPLALNDWTITQGWSDFLAAAGPFTAYLYVSVTANALRCSASTTFVSIEDLGKQY